LDAETSNRTSVLLSTSDRFSDFSTFTAGVAVCDKEEFESTHIYQLHKLVLRIASTIAKQKRVNIKGETLQCEFGFLEDYSPDAFAEKLEGRHGYGLNSGLVSLAYYLSGELFVVRDHRDQFRPTHPHPDLDGIDAKLLLAPDANLADRLMAHSARASHVVDKRRVAIAQYFREFLLLFALFHEFHHVIWGHCEFARAAAGARRLHETGPTKVKPIHYPIMHQVEFMADIGANDLLIWYVNKRSKLNFKWLTRISFADLHRLALVACGIMCAAWHAEDQKNGKDGAHPDPSARFGVLFAHYAKVIAKNNDDEFFKHKIGKLAVMDLIFLSEQCPELTAVVQDLTQLLSNPAHVANLESVFSELQPQTLAYEFRTQKEIATFGWS
jgi:hypothetical protein